MKENGMKAVEGNQAGPFILLDKEGNDVVTLLRGPDAQRGWKPFPDENTR